MSEPAHTVQETHQAKKAGMPQLDFDTFAAQIFWLAVTFAFLYLMMARVSLPRIREVLQNRQTRITGDLKKAELLKEEAESAQADFTSVLTEAREKAAQRIGKVRAKAAEEEAKRNAKLDENFARQTKEADQRVSVVRSEAQKKLVPVAAEAARQAVKKLLKVDVNASKAQAVAEQISNKQKKFTG